MHKGTVSSQTQPAVSFSTLAAGMQRLNELRTLQHDLQRKLGDKAEKEAILQAHGAASYNKWRQNRIRELDAVVPELQAVKEWCQRKRHEANAVGLARVTGEAIDPADPVQIVCALQNAILSLLHEQGASVASAAEDIRMIMRVADGFRAMEDQRYISWNEHIAALLDCANQRRHLVEQAHADSEARVKAVYAAMDRERAEWQYRAEQNQSPSRSRIVTKEPPDYTSLKEQIRFLQTTLNRARAALHAIREAEQVVTEKNLQAAGILSKVLMTPDLQDLITDAL